MSPTSFPATLFKNQDPGKSTFLKIELEVQTCPRRKGGFTVCLHILVMLILNSVDVQYLQNILLALKKIRMVKITPCQIPTTR